MVSPRVSVTVLGLVGLAWCALGASPGSTESPPHQSDRPLPPPRERLVWNQSHPEEADFVPEEVLATQPIDAIPMTEYLRATLLNEIQRQKDRVLHLVDGKPMEGGCRPSRDPVPAGSSYGAKELVDTILKRDAAVLATVDYVVPGWGQGYGGPQTMVYATVVEVLHDETGTFQPRGEVSFPRQGADIRVQGVQLCADPPKGEHEPRPNDRLLIAGNASTANPGRLLANTVFPVEQGALVPQPLAHIKGKMDWTIEELRAALAATGHLCWPLRFLPARRSQTRGVEHHPVRHRATKEERACSVLESQSRR